MATVNGFLSVSGEARLSAFSPISISAWSFFILPEAVAQTLLINWQGDVVATAMSGTDVVVDIDAAQSPPLSTSHWHFVVLNDGVWTVEQLDESDSPGMLIQHMSAYRDPLTQQQVDDLVSYATINAIVRSITDTSELTFSDDGATGLSTNWQTIGV